MGVGAECVVGVPNDVRCVKHASPSSRNQCAALVRKCENGVKTKLLGPIDVLWSDSLASDVQKTIFGGFPAKKLII